MDKKKVTLSELHEWMARTEAILDMGPNGEEGMYDGFDLVGDKDDGPFTEAEMINMDTVEQLADLTISALMTLDAVFHEYFGCR